jgi:anti-sigma factor RsiW
MRKHPSELAMEAYLLDPERSSVTEHLGGCEMCKSRLARMEKEGEDFRRFVLPATLDKVVEANTRRRFSLNGWMMAVPALAAAAALAVVVLPRRGRRRASGGLHRREGRPRARRLYDQRQGCDHGRGRRQGESQGGAALQGAARQYPALQPVAPID